MGRISEYYSAPPPRTARSECPAAFLGGGTYPRTLTQVAGARLYRVHKLCGDGEFATITQALAQWSADKQGVAAPRAAIIEIADSATYHEAPQVRLEAGEHLQLRAADLAQPVLRMFDYRSASPEQIRIVGAPGSSVTLDGLLVAGGAIEFDECPVSEGTGGARGRMRVALRHCTLVPGWDLASVALAPWRGKDSVLLRSANLEVQVERCILGPVRIDRGARECGLMALDIGDSIIDAGHAAGLAIADSAYGSAPASARFVRTTVIGLAQLEEVTLAENAVFLGALLVAQRCAGALRFCYVEQGSHTPRREYCQPDLALHARGASSSREVQRVRPRYVSLRYGTPGYCQLAQDCAAEISCGSEDDAGMGAVNALWHSAQPVHAAVEGDIFQFAM